MHSVNTHHGHGSYFQVFANSGSSKSSIAWFSLHVKSSFHLPSPPFFNHKLLSLKWRVGSVYVNYWMCCGPTIQNPRDSLHLCSEHHKVSLYLLHCPVSTVSSPYTSVGRAVFRFATCSSAQHTGTADGKRLDVNGFHCYLQHKIKTRAWIDEYQPAFMNEAGEWFSKGIPAFTWAVTSLWHTELCLLNAGLCASCFRKYT